MRHHKSDILGHWGFAMVAILVVAALSIPQIDKYMLGLDATNSVLASGWLVERAHSPFEVLDSLRTASPDQGPLYFLLLNQWGSLVGQAIALARLLTVFCGLLSLAIAYRLGRDAVSPLAGNFAVIILASNAFYSFYLAHVRFYPLVVLLSALVIWLYLRIAVLERAGRRRDFIALVVSCSALVSTHAFGLLIYIVCSLYHLLFVPKNRRWLVVIAAAVSALALAGPLVYVMFTKGVEFAVTGHGPRADSLEEVLTAWFHVTANGSPLLLLLAAVGCAVGWRRKCLALRRSAILFVLLLLSISITAVVTRTLDVGLMRHLFAGLPIAVLFQAAGLYALYSVRKWLGALLCLWVIAGLSFHTTGDWLLYVQGRLYSYLLPPWHLISRTAQQSNVPAHVIGFNLRDHMLHFKISGNLSLYDHWFTRQDVELRLVDRRKWLEEYLRLYEGSRRSPWLVYQKSRTDITQLAELEATMDKLGYRACQQVSLPVTTEMAQYSWISLDCQPERVLMSNEAAPLRYQFYGAEFDPSGTRLHFAYKWASQNQEPVDLLKISHQLITKNWGNAAQLDRRLAQEDKLRQFAIDVSAVPSGTYRLMAIVYNPDTGITLNWKEAPGDPPSMLYLQDVEIH